LTVTVYPYINYSRPPHPHMDRIQKGEIKIPLSFSA
jgi:hypothetical protein